MWFFSKVRNAIRWYFLSPNNEVNESNNCGRVFQFIRLASFLICVLFLCFSRYFIGLKSKLIQSANDKITNT